MKKIKKEVKEGTTFFSISRNDAIELVLFIIFLAAVMGAFFKEKFIYIIFALIIIFVWYELHRYKKDNRKRSEKIEKRIDKYREKKAKKSRAAKERQQKEKPQKERKE